MLFYTEMVIQTNVKVMRPISKGHEEGKTTVTTKQNDQNYYYISIVGVCLQGSVEDKLIVKNITNITLVSLQIICLIGFQSSMMSSELC